MRPRLVVELLQSLLLFAAPSPFATARRHDAAAPRHQRQLTTPSDDRQKLLRGQSLGDGPSTATVFDPLEDMRRALDVMQTSYFELSVGTWPTSIDWTGAVINTYVVSALSTLSKALESASAPVNGLDIHRSEVNAVENELNRYFSQNVAYYYGENAFELRNEAYDDMLWVVLGWLESIKFVNTHSKLHFRPVSEQSKPWHGSQFIDVFAHRARVFYDITTRGWDTELCGGGMIWTPGLDPYKNAITNQLYIAASVGMYLYFPGDRNPAPFVPLEPEYEGFDLAEPHDPRYLKAAIQAYDWLKRSNMTSAQGLYVDGFHIVGWRNHSSQGTKRCDDRNEMVYTYNQGVVLSGLRGLWEATGNRSYLEDGHQLARNAIKATGWLLESASASSDSGWRGMGRGGILEEFCDATGSCNQNGQTFKGIFFHHLTLFCEPLPLEPLVPGKTHIAGKELALLHHQSCQEYAIWVAHNTRAAMDTRDQKGRFGAWWGSKSGYVEDVPLPQGAVDYRNNASVLLHPPWLASSGQHQVRHETQQWRHASYSNTELPEEGKDPLLPLKDEEPHTNWDFNDRGRGRTVETQGGGVAVLRALWDLLNMT